MKFDLKVRTRFVKSMEGDDKPIGFALTINDKTFELRKRHSFETKVLNDVGEVVFEGESNHGWKPQRGGLWDEAFLGLPKDLCLHVSKDKMTYAEAVGLNEDYSLNWIIDEFDSSFDDLAIASMRYHMDWSVASCSLETRAKYESLINRFLDLRDVDALYSAEDRVHIEECVKKHEGTDDPFGSRSKCDECDRIMVRVSDREDELKVERNRVRKDFVDIMPGLWS